MSYWTDRHCKINKPKKARKRFRWNLDGEIWVNQKEVYINQLFERMRVNYESRNRPT